MKTLGILAMALGLGYHPTPARLGVSAKEFHLTLSRPSVKAGVVEIELQNDGEDPHDVRVRRIGGKHTFSIPLTKAGSRRSASFNLKPGRYRLWCSVATHGALGMQAVLRVRR
jgi:hypothetical protein